MFKTNIQGKSSTFIERNFTFIECFIFLFWL